ncbi:MAG: substrate-binding domain-containing protein [Muribaculaceae bacterium]|nr:substrate-binding domain-containing protein [Muribaculaceae bacterium]
MKKLSSVFFILALFLLVFESCRQERPYRIAVSQCSSDDWRRKMNDEIECEIMLHPEAVVEIRSGEDNSEKQIADIRYFVDNKFDIIVVAPNEAEALTPVIDEVYKSGIPVIIFDRNISSESFTAYLGVDNKGIGASAAHYALHLTPNAKIVEIRGLSGSTPAMDRNAGFVEVIAETPASIVASADGKWNYDDAMLVADSLLKAHPDADVVYAHNDRMAIAASDVAHRLGLDPYIIGIDAAPEIGIKAVADGIIDATFLYPTEGNMVVDLALSILKGEPYDRVMMIPALSAVDASNADILLKQSESLQVETANIKALKSQVDEFWLRHSAQTTLFYASIAILALLCGVLFLLLKAYWVRKNNQAVLERQNKLLEKERDTQRLLNEQLEVATQSKLVFFTNVSHDLRTPLTLIAEPVAELAEARNLTPEQHSMMTIANRNVNILRRLINQILDFRKFENGKLTLHLTEANFGTLIKEWCESFEALARQRNIKLTIDAPDNAESYHYAVDVAKLERVVFNLLSNAFRYTPDNGSIKVSWSSDNENLSLSVKDTGIGISKEDIANIFERFFQVDKVSSQGSGIGLALTKALVELHEGTLTVDSEPGKGSTFTITLPVKHVEERAPEQLNGHISENAVLVDDIIEDLPADNYDQNDKPLLLIIDDNDDIRALVGTMLGKDYRVIGARNGSIGLRMAAKYVPDIIVCDVMMPVVDGMECLRKLKEETSTSHIPVLMLTACSMDEQRVEAFEIGADGYVAKPFNTAVLEAQCRSLIANRRRIKMSDIDTPIAATPSAPALGQTDIDDEFYAQFLEIFRNEIGNADLNVDSLAGRLGLGRSQFYRKIKSLTNYSPVELIRNLRLRHARALLRTTSKTVSEIAYEVGFSNPAYFTKCYRDAYGETPTALRENLQM